MKIINIKYGKTYSLGNFCSERIDLEASIDSGTEDVYECLEKLKDTCDTYHKCNNPQLYTETKQYPYQLEGGAWVTEKEVNGFKTGGINISDIPPSTPKTQPHSTIEAINSCTTLKVLQEFDLIVKNMSNKYPEIMEAYDKKLLELSE